MRTLKAWQAMGDCHQNSNNNAVLTRAHTQYTLSLVPQCQHHPFSQQGWFSTVSAAVLAAALGRIATSTAALTVPAMYLFVKFNQPQATHRHTQSPLPPLSLLCEQHTRPLTHTHHQHTENMYWQLLLLFPQRVLNQPPRCSSW